MLNLHHLEKIIIIFIFYRNFVSFFFPVGVMLVGLSEFFEPYLEEKIMVIKLKDMEFMQMEY